MAKEEKAILWSERIQELRSSGLTVKEWCLEHKVPYSTMGYWLRKLNRKESKKETELIFAKLPSEKEIVAKENTGNGICCCGMPFFVIRYAQKTETE